MKWSIIICLALSGCAKTPVCENDIEAFVMSQDFIKRQLKSPSTASFPLINDPDVSVERTSAKGQCSFIVNTHVDAQNSFGATVRERFRVELYPSDEARSEWSLISIRSE